MTQFGNLRALLQRKPTRRTHRQILDLIVEALDTHSESDVLGRWVPYAAGHIRQLRKRSCQITRARIPEVLCGPAFASLFPRLRVHDIEDLRWSHVTLPGVPVRLILDASSDASRCEPWPDALAALSPEQLRDVSGVNLYVPGHKRGERDALLEWLESAPLPNLDALVLTGLGLRDTELSLLLEASWMPNVRALHLSCNALSSASVDALLHHDNTQNLRSLHLHQNPLGAAAAAAFDGEAHKGLMHLGLSGVRLGDVGVQTLAKSTALGNLRHLDIDNNDITALGVRALAGSKTLGHLLAIQLGSNPISDDCADALSEFRGLRLLDLKRTEVADGCCAALAANPALRQLDTLHLSSTGISDEGVKHLAASEYFGSMSHLSMVSPKVWGDGVEALLASPHVGRVGHLDFPMHRLAAQTQREVVGAHKFGLRTRMVAVRKILSQHHLRWSASLERAICLGAREHDWTSLQGLDPLLLAKVLHWPEMLGVRALSIQQLDLESKPTLCALLEAPALTDLDSLEVRHCTLSPESLHALLSYAHRLRRLSLLGSMPSKLHDTFAAYARANTLPSDLDLSGARFERDRMHILSHGHAFPGVQDLSLSRCLMYEHCPALLAACHGLETLDLSDNPWLMASSLRPLPRLRHLKLSRTLTSVEALQEILTRSWDALETLELERCGLSEGGLDVLLETSHLPALRALRVGQNPISLQRVQSLFDAPNLPALEHVHFHKQHLNPALLARLDAIGAAEHDLTVEGVELLGRLGDCMSEDALRRVVAWLDVKTQADTLDLSDTTFSGQALPMLAKASGARHIYTLNLARCGLRSEDLQAWFSTTAFNHIQSLDLSGNPLGEGAASAFLGIQLWNLRHLWLRDIGLTDSAIAPMEFWYFARHLLTLELAGNHFSPAGYAQLSTFQNFPEALRATFEP